MILGSEITVPIIFENYDKLLLFNVIIIFVMEFYIIL
jgi:hypothetical protein